MNLNLNYEGFESYLVKRINLNYEGFESYLVKRINLITGVSGVQYIFRFPNNYGASVVKHKCSYGYRDDLWELAVLEYRAEVCNICYDTEITDDVLGYLTDEKVREILEKIKNL